MCGCRVMTVCGCYAVTTHTPEHGEVSFIACHCTRNNLEPGQDVPYHRMLPTMCMDCVLSINQRSGNNPPYTVVLMHPILQTTGLSKLCADLQHQLNNSAN